ncbi:heterodisulfide reductase-related iron-sulfur binding cluster [Desulforhabdus sp. TSK]|uniref:heterodisulfide reductase-related iron-sulfur binding cluster n=1 Tax=Desulforhabdus sp. TSK TaxID=2925014 RepID=UPI001FC872DD|nr:heterodisulfide reductase-related iron-sulfur binding cluster [Desulforhabdus sp. TSK]GKT07744.1 electron transporter [Desulforhabdus sp. TSK]
MELTREIYWNVGHSVMVPMYAMAVLAVVVMLQGIFERIEIYRKGKRADRTDDLKGRIAVALKNAFSQRHVLRVRAPGIGHSLFFWGFLLLTLGTLLIFLQADLTDPVFGWKFLSGSFYKFYSLVLDIAGLVALIMLCGLSYRRYWVRPAGLESDLDDAIMHGLLFAILVTGFVIEGARMAVTELGAGNKLAVWSPVGLSVARQIAGMGEESLRALHKTTWWIHFFLTMAFFVALPRTKFRHILTITANYVFADHRRKGSLDTPDLEDEQVASYGASHLKDLTWKDILDSDACVECKRCQDRCPAWNTNKPLSPMKLIGDIREIAFEQPDAQLVETIGRDALWACTTCRACQEICPATVEHVNKIIEMRRHLVLMKGEFPGDEVMEAANHLEVNGNPLGMAFSSRGDWADGLSVTRMSDNADVDILYFVGCYASFDKRNIKVAKSFVQLCEAAGIKVGILGKEEKCCGEPVRKLGNEYLYQSLAVENIEVLKGYGVKRIVTACPHCFNTLDRDYRDLGFNIQVEHYVTYLQNLVRQGRLKLRPERFSCTYHDSCYVGRYNDIYLPPRELLHAAGAAIREMERNRQEGFCCGGGGGRVVADEKIGSRICETRAKMAADTGAGLLISNCPFCLTMFEDGIKGAALEGKLVPRDIAEILVERLEKQ